MVERDGSVQISIAEYHAAIMPKLTSLPKATLYKTFAYIRVKTLRCFDLRLTFVALFYAVEFSSACHDIDGKILLVIHWLWLSQKINIMGTVKSWVMFQFNI